MSTIRDIIEPDFKDRVQTGRSMGHRSIKLAAFVAFALDGEAVPVADFARMAEMAVSAVPLAVRELRRSGMFVGGLHGDHIQLRPSRKAGVA